MAKLKGPLFSLGASQQLGKALVFFPWKGLNVVREYVVPSNPKTSGQTTQRGYLTAAVAYIHSVQAFAAHPLKAVDISAYALWGSIFATPRTWFNQVVKNFIDQRVDTLTGKCFSDGSSTPGAGTLLVSLYETAGTITAGTFYYGTSKTALVHTQAATVAASRSYATIAGLTANVKYFWQFRPTTPAGAVGARSGIYYGTPT